RRRKRGDKSKNAKVAFVGVLYTLRKTRRCGLKAPAPRGLVLLRASRVESRGPFPLWLPSTGGALRAPSVGPAHGEGGDDAENAGDRKEVDGEAEVNGARLGRPGVEPEDDGQDEERDESPPHWLTPSRPEHARQRRAPRSPTTRVPPRRAQCARREVVCSNSSRWRLVLSKREYIVQQRTSPRTIRKAGL